MNGLKRSLVVLALILVISGVIVFQTGAYYSFQRLFAPNQPASHNSGNSTISLGNGNHDNSRYNNVNTILNYGNSTSIWFNETKVPLGWTFYNLTLMIANGKVDGYYDSNLKEHYINGINGVEQSLPNYWSLWTFCGAKNAWMYSIVGADRLTLSNNSTYGWYYSTGNSPPVQGASTTTSC